MKYAILSDIHGNQYALEEVLEESKRLGINKLMLLGDYIGYYYGIETVLEQIRQFDFVAIRGNHEDLLRDCMNSHDILDSVGIKYGESHRQCVEKLSLNELDFLTELPRTLELKVDDLKVLLCHGAPWSTDEYVYPDVDNAVLKRYDEYNYDFIFFGHTHHQTKFTRPSMQIINPGSVGQSRQKGGMAFWCILDSERKKVEFMQTPYDISTLAKEIIENDPGLSYNLSVLRR